LRVVSKDINNQLTKVKVKVNGKTNFAGKLKLPLKTLQIEVFWVNNDNS